MRTRQGRITLLIVVIGVAVVAGAGILLERPIREHWYISKLDSHNHDERSRAAAKLVEMKSKRAEARFIALLLRHEEVTEKIVVHVEDLAEMRSVEGILALKIVVAVESLGESPRISAGAGYVGTSRALHFDDLRSQVGQQTAGVGQGEDVGRI